MSNNFESRLEAIKIGVCSVDSGTLMVGDPHYFRPVDPKVSAEIHRAGIERLSSGHVQLHYAKGHAGLGVLVGTTHGDGTYPVFLETTENGRRLIVDLD